jgi:uncharacterized membrane protein
MLVLLVLILSLLLFRGLGALGLPIFATWMESTRYALAVLFLFGSTAHFNKMRHDLARMMPASFRHPMPLVYFTGVCEIFGAVGILLPRTRSLAGLCLCLFLLCVFPANIRAAREGMTIGGRAATALWLRLPMQLLFLVLIFWSTQPLLAFSSRFRP